MNGNGTYTIADPTGNLVAGYEVPGYIMVVESNKSGPNLSTPALITAVETKPATIACFAGQTFNYIQFRTASGGFEFGFVSIDAQGAITHDGYWPMGGMFQPPQTISGGSFAASSIAEDPSGNYFSLNESNGSILGLPQTVSSSFDPASAGTYKALFYQKSNAQMGAQNVESGTVTEFQGTVTVGANGSFSVADNSGNVLATGTLAAVAATPYLYDGTANTLTNPCNGLFTFQTITANSQQSVVATFQGSAVLFASFQTALPLQSSNSYNYFYGVGLK